MNIEKKEKVMSKYADYIVDNFKDEMLKSMYVLLLPVLALGFVERHFTEEDLKNNFEEIYEQIFVLSLFKYTSFKEKC